MKSYSEHKNSSMSMVSDPLLAENLVVLSKQSIDIIIETGTFLGTGSTRMVAEAFKESAVKFYTLEINQYHFEQAKKNLAKYSFVECINGCSLPLKESIEFIENDDAIVNHNKYPDFFIDDVNNPKEFYSKEILALKQNKGLMHTVKNFLSGSNAPKENLLHFLMQKEKTKNIFFILDSAGGAGWLEFQTVLKDMNQKPYWLLLDDTHHLKHFRSLEYIKTHPEFRILAENYTNGWVLAKHR